MTPLTFIVWTIQIIQIIFCVMQEKVMQIWCDTMVSKWWFYFFSKLSL